MCFGSQTSTSQQAAPSWLQTAGVGNTQFAQNLQNAGYQNYGGQFVAPFSSQQQQSFGMGGNVAGAAASNANGGANALSQALSMSGSAPQVNSGSIAGGMSPFMNQYVGMALAPQISAANNQFALNQQLMQGQATSAGAFGDPRATMLQQNQQLNNNLSMQGLVGNAYNAAFNTALGGSAQQQAQNLQAQTTNAGLYNQGVQNLLAGSNQAYNQGVGGTNLLNTLGSQQTAQQQARDNAYYNQYLLSQQYPFQTTGLVNSTMQAALPQNVTTTLTQPNNAGYGILGSLLGGAGSAFGGYQQGAGSSALAAALMAAEGGDVPEGTPTLVGEKGPEVFTPQQPGTVIPYKKLREALKKKQRLKVPDLGPAKSATPSFGIAA